MQELSEWNARYRQKFGFVFLICASGRSSDEILAELKVMKLEFAFQADINIKEHDFVEIQYLRGEIFGRLLCFVNI